MASGFIEADRFEAGGAGASITYDLRTGEIRYRGPTRPPLEDFVEVTESSAPLDTPVGRLVTATLQQSEDGDTATVSVLLPRVNLSQVGDEGGADTAFEAVAVFTTTRTSIGGPKLVEGPIQSYVAVAMAGTASRTHATTPCRFTAVLNRELPGPGLLRVEGECTLPSTGYQLALVRQEPQGVNPRDLLLQLLVTPPEMSGPALTTYVVSYEEPTTSYFDTVTILPDGLSVVVENIS